MHVPDGDGPWLGVLVFLDASAWTECELYDPVTAALAAVAGDIAREHLSKEVELLVLPETGSRQWPDQRVPPGRVRWMRFSAPTVTH